MSSLKRVSLLIAIWTVVLVYASAADTSTIDNIMDQVTPDPEAFNSTSTRKGRGYAGDSYLEEAYNDCITTKKTWACVKYKGLKYIHKMASPLPDNAQSSEGISVLGSSVRLITIPEKMAVSKDSLKEIFPDYQPRSSDSELDRLYKFALREAERFVRSHALSLRVPTGPASSRDLDSAQAPRLVDEEHPEEDIQDLSSEGRGKKKKLALLLPLLLFFKLKMLLVPILLGVLFIKKLLILAAILFPSMLSLVKFCKPHHGHSYTGWSSGPDSSGEYSTGYGHVAPYHGDYHSRRSARWDAHSMAYRGYNHRASEDQGV